MKLSLSVDWISYVGFTLLVAPGARNFIGGVLFRQVYPFFLAIIRHFLLLLGVPALVFQPLIWASFSRGFVHPRFLNFKLDGNWNHVPILAPNVEGVQSMVHAIVATLLQVWSYLSGGRRSDLFKAAVNFVASREYLVMIIMMETIKLNTLAIMMTHILYYYSVQAYKQDALEFSGQEMTNLLYQYSTTSIDQYVKHHITKVCQARLGPFSFLSRPLLAVWRAFFFVWNELIFVPCCFAVATEMFIYGIASIDTWLRNAIAVSTEESGHEHKRSRKYKLKNIDFSTRSKLVSTLAIHVRRARFYDAKALHLAILKELKLAAWSDRKAFKKCLPTMVQFNHGFDFLAWLLEWNVSLEDFDEYVVDECGQCECLELATNYAEACEVFRKLDTLPYVLAHWNEMFHFLTTEGALSHPPIAQAVVNHFAEFPWYFLFFKSLDRKWWSQAVDVEGRPATRERRYCFQPPSSRSGPVRVDRESLPPPPSATHDRSNFTLVFIEPEPATVACWSMSSEVSLISSSLVEELGHTPRATGFSLVCPVGFSEYAVFEEKIVSLNFTIPGISGTLSADFAVMEAPLAPVIMGRDFWMNYDIAFRNGLFNSTTNTPIPSLNQVALDSRAESGQYPNMGQHLEVVDFRVVRRRM